MTSKYLPQVTSAKYVSDYTIATTFDDGTSKHIDIGQYFHGPVFKPLKNQKYFKRFFLDGGSLAWPNGVDIAPEALYEAEDLRLGHNDSVERTRPRSARSRRPR